MLQTLSKNLDYSMHLRVTSFPLADANGNCVTFSDNLGNVQAHYEYDAFGNTVSSDGDMADDFRYRFSSKYLDDETGLYYYGYRYYAPALGRWMSRDPIRRILGWRPEALLDEPGLYSFLRNACFGWVDYLGLIGIQKGFPPYKHPSNCLGGAMTEKNNQYRYPSNSVGDPEDSFADALGKEGWVCKEVFSSSECQCECEQRQMLITLYEDFNPDNTELNPWFSKDFDFSGRETNIHAISTPYGGCQYEQIEHARPHPQRFNTNIRWDLLFFPGDPMLCCCKDRY